MKIIFEIWPDITKYMYHPYVVCRYGQYWLFAFAKTKTQISCAVTAQLISAFVFAKNKDADQLRSNCAADQRLCFHYTDSTIPLLPKSEISNL